MPSTHKISIVIPAHNEAGYIEDCLKSIEASCARANVDYETIVVLNRCTDLTETVASRNGARCLVFDEPCIAAVRNHGVESSKGELVVTIDADSTMDPKTIPSIIDRYGSGRDIAGDTGAKPERWSLGIILSVLSLAPYLAGTGVQGGLFWFTRASFDAIGGFDDSLLSVEDLDFGARLKAYCRSRGKQYRRLAGCRITTSCRKFDQFGDWYLLKNRGLVRRIFSGRDREAADSFYYKTGRK